MRNQERWKGRVDANGRECSTCGRYKRWKLYSPNSTSRTGYSSSCKECRGKRYGPRIDPVRQRAYYLARKYGITPEQYTILADQQRHRCKLCGEPEVERKRVAKDGTVRIVSVLGIDHDHSCPNHAPSKACRACIRGLLCDDCNRLLGFAESKPRVAERFRDYLVRRPLM